MESMAAKLLVGVLEKFLTQKFLSKVLVYTISAWSKQTENDWDDKVTSAMAEALDVPVEQVKK